MKISKLSLLFLLVPMCANAFDDFSRFHSSFSVTVEETVHNGFKEIKSTSKALINLQEDLQLDPSDLEGFAIILYHLCEKRPDVAQQLAKFLAEKEAAQLQAKLDKEKPEINPFEAGNLHSQSDELKTTYLDHNGNVVAYIFHHGVDFKDIRVQLLSENKSEQKNDSVNPEIKQEENK